MISLLFFIRNNNSFGDVVTRVNTRNTIPTPVSVFNPSSNNHNPAVIHKIDMLTSRL
ncbi:hypothetical protein GCM10007855_32730 [Aliivibrio sifiae]|uniref:Uncharacterized protein n=1 Tax=Aliivibrio sifiae TaxID=566293 RepID=A0ABQ6AQH9_9GAMM|nr:hypothetical protein GCM10007855_32730 [Aliivibrio sifiae]